jgi:hypothetical protein
MCAYSRELSSYEYTRQLLFICVQNNNNMRENKSFSIIA